MDHRLLPVLSFLTPEYAEALFDLNLSSPVAPLQGWDQGRGLFGRAKTLL